MRPDPDALLRQIEGEFEGKAGRLKVFLGYASGVGKSFKMLDEGRRRRERGQDVVVGAIQEELNEELLPILSKLELIPLRYIRNKPVMDLDAILRRKPMVCLVDGLAYDNPPGCRNAKRWQDVEELINAGISVIGSINVQFIEEVQGRVEAITGKHVAESVPRKFINSADEIAVVDAPPETCFVRSQQTGIDVRALEQRLSELRELALLLAADVVDVQLEKYLHKNGITSQYGAQERILICLSPCFDAATMIASGKRNAERFRCELYAVFVRNHSLEPASERQIEKNIQEAREAGAAVEVLEEDDPVEAVLEFARSRSVTQIFVGQSAQPKWWQKWTGSSLDRLIRQAEGIDIRVFPQ